VGRLVGGFIFNQSCFLYKGDVPVSFGHKSVYFLK
jgi:hypothetical protein